MDKEFKIGPRPANAKKFPGAKVGDFLYRADSDSETGLWIERFLVVGLCPNDEVLCVRADIPNNHESFYAPALPHYACGRLYSSPSEALLEQAESEIEWHGRALANAKKAKKDAAIGKVDEYICLADPHEGA